MASPIYSVTCFTRALVSPGYTRQTDYRWLECLWGTYTSYKCAELTGLRDILDDPDYGNYKILYDEDIPRLDEYGESDYACGNGDKGIPDYAWSESQREVMRVVITIKDHGIPVMETTVCIVKSVSIPESEIKLKYPEEFDEEWEVKLTKQQIRSRSMESHDNTIAMGIIDAECVLTRTPLAVWMKETIEDYDFAIKYAEQIHKYGSKTSEAKGEAAATYKYELARDISNERDWVFTTQYGWFKKDWATEETARDRRFHMFADWIRTEEVE